MWLQETQIRKWRPDSLEARIFALAEAEAHANGAEDATDEAMESVFSVLGWLYSSPYSVVKDRILDAFGVETSEAALSGFWKRFSGPWLMERMKRSSAAARTLAGELDTEGVTKATLDLVAQQAFETLANPDGNPAQVVKLVKVLLASQKQAIEERKVALLEAKARQADEAKTVLSDGGLSEEERTSRMRAIFGM